jgi:hypothetical protein
MKVLKASSITIFFAKVSRGVDEAKMGLVAIEMEVCQSRGLVIFRSGVRL